MTAFEAVVLDVDGTLVRGDRALPGAPEAIGAIRERGLPLRVVTNNPTRPPADYVGRLDRAGIGVDREEVVTAGSVTADHLTAEHPDAPTYVVGEAGLREQLTDRGVAVGADPERATVVVGSIDRSFDYDRLAESLQALRGDPDPTFVGTDPDRVIPAPEGDVPGSGAVIDAMASVAGRRPDVIAGKPGRPARAATFDRLDADPSRCLVVGDRRDTDVALGDRAGATTALVETGVPDRAPAPIAVDDRRRSGRPTPDHVLSSVGDLPSLLDG